MLASACPARQSSHLLPIKLGLKRKWGRGCPILQGLVWVEASGRNGTGVFPPAPPTLYLWLVAVAPLPSLLRFREEKRRMRCLRMRTEGWKLPQLNFKNPWLVAMVTERCIPLPWQQANTEVCCWDWGFGMWPEGVGVGGWAWAIAVLCVCVWGGGTLCSLGSHPHTFPGARSGWALPLQQWDQRRKTVGSNPLAPTTHSYLTGLQPRGP